MRDAFIVGIRMIKWRAVVVHGDIERLGIGAKLMALQVTPFVANGAQRALSAVFGHFELLGQGRLVVAVE